MATDDVSLASVTKLLPTFIDDLCMRTRRQIQNPNDGLAMQQAQVQVASLLYREIVRLTGDVRGVEEGVRLYDESCTGIPGLPQTFLGYEHLQCEECGYWFDDHGELNAECPVQPNGGG